MVEDKRKFMDLLPYITDKDALYMIETYEGMDYKLCKHADWLLSTMVKRYNLYPIKWHELTAKDIEPIVEKYGAVITRSRIHHNLSDFMNDCCGDYARDLKVQMEGIVLPNGLRVGGPSITDTNCDGTNTEGMCHGFADYESYLAAMGR